MGANVSSQTIDSVSTTTNNVLNSVLTNMVNSSTAGSYSNQEIYINVSDSNCRTVYAVQKASNKLSALSQMSSETLTNLSNELKNKITKDIEQAAKQENTGLNLGQVNTSVMDQAVSSYLSNNIKNIVSTSISNIISNTSSSTQKITIYAKNMPNCDEISADQDIIIEQISNSIASNIVTNTLKNVADNEDVQKLSQKSDQKNAGLSLMFGVILLLIVGICIYFGKTAMSYIIPILMIAVGYGIFYFSSTKQKITMAVLIIIEILLFMFELYCIFSKPTIPNMANIPIPSEIQGTISIKK